MRRAEQLGVFLERKREIKEAKIIPAVWSHSKSSGRAKRRSRWLEADGDEVPGNRQATAALGMVVRGGAALQVTVGMHTTGKHPAPSAGLRSEVPLGVVEKRVLAVYTSDIYSLLPLHF